MEKNEDKLKTFLNKQKQEICQQTHTAEGAACACWVPLARFGRSILFGRQQERRETEPAGGLSLGLGVTWLGWLAPVIYLPPALSVLICVVRGVGV